MTTERPSASEEEYFARQGAELRRVNALEMQRQTYLAHAAQFATIFGGRSDDQDERGSPLGSLLLVLVAPIAATLIQLGITRSREYLADETGAHLTGDPEALARALEKMETAVQRLPAHVEPATSSLFIVRPLPGGRSLLSLFSTLPRMEERTRRLRGLTVSLERVPA